MKINRLLEITTILLNKKTVTAAELAERFGVSTRTIYRDIDVLSASGIPVYSTQGVNGGISIMEQYAVSRAMLSESEKQNILFALKSLQATKYPQLEGVIDKLQAVFRHAAEDWISVDFSPWGSNPDAYHKFSDIKQAILDCRVISFDYITADNSPSHREIEPLRLIFKSQAWYLWGYCLKRQDYRTFRVSRIKGVTVTERTFSRTQVHVVPDKDPKERVPYKPMVHLKLQFTSQALSRLYDDFDDSLLHKQDDGTFLLEVDFPEDEWVYGYLLGFGPAVKVLSPPHIREILRQRSRQVLAYYQAEGQE